MPALITVAHVELQGSGSHEYTEDGGSARRFLLCDYIQADTLVQQLLGYTRPLGTQFQYRDVPHRHPRRPYLYCQEARYEGVGVASTGLFGVTYPKARVTAIYRPLEPDDERQRSRVFMTERREFGGEILTMEGSTVGWAEGPDANLPLGGEARAGTFQPLIHLTLEIHHWLSAPVSDRTFEDAVGKINQNTFRALWTTWPRESLLFVGAGIQRDYTVDGLAGFQVSLQFQFKRQGWNKLRHPNGRYYKVHTLEERTPLYESMDFTGLLP